MCKIIESGSLTIKIYDTREKLGVYAAYDIGTAIYQVLQKKEFCNMIFAAAPSQNETLAALRANRDIAWNRVNAFHMDEYVGLSPVAPQSFAHFLHDALFDHLPFHSINCLNGINDPAREAARYSALLREFPTDIVCMGIGENGHIAFNDPHEADFHDKALVKTVELDEVCRQQQVNDGCFTSLEDVPRHALTLSIPALLSAQQVFCMVPAASKARAVRDAVLGPVTEACPASIVRTHPSPVLYLDVNSARLF